MPDLSHLWQRFLLASALLFGLVLGVAATVFGYSNTSQVAVGWSVFHIASVPLWTVALVPLAVVLVAGTVYHWFNSLHHFTEHMRHRHRVHELEAEVASLRAHLDHLLEMPEQSPAAQPGKPVAIEVFPEEPAPALAQAAPSNGDEKSARKSRKRVSLFPAAEAEPAASPSGASGHLPMNGEDDKAPREESSPEA